MGNQRLIAVDAKEVSFHPLQGLGHSQEMDHAYSNWELTMQQLHIKFGIENRGFQPLSTSPKRSDVTEFSLHYPSNIFGVFHNIVGTILTIFLAYLTLFFHL